MTVSTIGLDIAKNVFHAVALDAKGQELWRKCLRRSKVLPHFAQVPPCRVGLEACAGSHHWGRALEGLGHEVRLLPPRVVKGYLPGVKNDYKDAFGIAEAASRESVRAVALKAPWQQELQGLHRLREGVKSERNRLVNRVRGVLGEFGIVIPQGIAHLRRRLPEVLEDGDNELPPSMREALCEELERLRALDAQMREHDQRLEAHRRAHEPARRLAQVPGIGTMGATALPAALGSATQFANGRAMSASLGLVPDQYSTGGRTVLLGITKRGDRYLRTLLIHGARSVLRNAHKRDDALSRWARQVEARRGRNVATVALANKLARIAWVILARGESYQARRAT